MYLSQYLSGEALDLIDKYMPDRGEGETQASQACTAVNKLLYKWYNDGDVFDNRYALTGWLNDISSYANWLYTHKLGSDILNRIRRVTNKKEYEQLLDDLAKAVINANTIQRLEALPKDGSIYNAAGPFVFDEYLNYGDTI